MRHFKRLPPADAHAGCMHYHCAHKLHICCVSLCSVANFPPAAVLPLNHMLEAHVHLYSPYVPCNVYTFLRGYSIATKAMLKLSSSLRAVLGVAYPQHGVGVA